MSKRNLEPVFKSNYDFFYRESQSSMKAARITNRANCISVAGLILHERPHLITHVFAELYLKSNVHFGVGTYDAANQQFHTVEMGPNGLHGYSRRLHPEIAERFDTGEQSIPAYYPNNITTYDLEPRFDDTPFIAIDKSIAMQALKTALAENTHRDAFYAIKQMQLASVTG